MNYISYQQGFQRSPLSHCIFLRQWDNQTAHFFKVEITKDVFDNNWNSFEINKNNHHLSRLNP